MKSISIILVNFNGYGHTCNALGSILQHSPKCEVVMVDNNSTDRSKDLLPAEFPTVTFIPLDENRGFGAANNAGAAVAKGEYLFFLNNDTLLIEDTPANLASILSNQQEVGVCGPKLLNDDRTFQLSFGSEPSIVEEWKTRRMQQNVQQRHRKTIDNLERIYRPEANVDWVTGAALMISSDLFRRIGRFDERFFMYFEDADLCTRVRKEGYQVRYVPETKVIHFGGKSYVGGNERILMEYRSSQLYFYKKHRSKLQQVSLRLYLLIKFLSGLLLSFVQPARPRHLYKKLLRLTLSTFLPT